MSGLYRGTTFCRYPSLSSRIVIVLIGLCVLFAVVAPASFAAGTKPSAQHGELHLENWDLGNQGPIELIGEWAFYWQSLLEPSQLQMAEQPAPTGWILLPSSWNGYLIDDREKEEHISLKGDGYATFRLTIYTGLSDQELSLNMPTIFSAYKLWVNGKLAASAGTVGTTQASMNPAGIRRIADITPQNGRIDLLLQVSNFNHMRGGVSKPLKLGTADQIVSQSEKSLAFEMFVIGTLLAMGIYHLALFAIRRKDRTPLYFGIFSIVWGVRGLLVGHVVWTKIFPAFPWELQIKMEYCALFGGLLLFILYQDHMFPGEMSKRFRKFSTILGLAQCAFVCITPAKIYSFLLPAQQILIVAQIVCMLYFLFKALKHRKEGAKLLVLFAMFMILTVFNDFLYYGEIFLVFGDLSPFGFLVFTIGQVIILSKRFAGSFGMVERYSEMLEQANANLKELNENLEMIVLSRSKELHESNAHLQQSNEEIQRVERSRKLLLSYISHDLRNEMTVIMGFTEAISDKIRADLHDRFIGLIHDKVINIDRMIDDLYYLSQLESGQMPLRMKPVRFPAFIRDVYSKHDAEVAGNSLRFDFANFEEDGGIEAADVIMDVSQLERVFANLIQNAVKFTPQGGQITLGYRLVENLGGNPSANEDLSLEEAAAALDNGSGMLQGNGFFEVEVADTGAGILDEDLPHIFEHYYRGQHGRAGSGLGLAICKEIVERHGGQIWAESAYGSGSRFCVRLPLMVKGSLD